MRYRAWLTAVAVVAFVALWARGAAAQPDPLGDARRLYESAAYEEALVALDAIDPAGLSVPTARDRHLLRALTLLALGREEDAREAMRGAVEADPAFVPDASAVAPRVREMFLETRRRHVTSLVRERYAAARETLAQKAHAGAEAEFTAVCALIDATRPTLPPGEAAMLGDLRVLAQGFLDLSRESREMEERRAATVEGAAPQASPEREEREGGSAPAAAPPRDSDIVPPVPLAQPLPPPIRIPGLVAGQVYRGAIELDIDAAGAVTDARLVTSIHPVYDVRVLDAARRWQYRPATRQGVAVPYTRVVNIVVEPPE